MLSILIPTYNQAIDQLVTTIWNQCEKVSFPFEIIVIDDCSTDDNVLLLNKSITKLKHCHYYHNKENKGRTASRNLLATRAAYDWLLFLDADVAPVSEKFIDNFNIEGLTNEKVISGGVEYKADSQGKNKMLRWIYGKNREAKSVAKRMKDEYSIISANLLIDKETFLKANVIEQNAYGLDILFSYNLKQLVVPIKHIHNPVYHLGLETTDVFMKKSLKSIETTFYLEEEGLIDNDTRPVQKAYVKLKQFRAINVFKSLIKRFEKPMLKNLRSEKPSMLIFDLYRLYHYVKLKSNA